jgi:hypothetical protein
MLIETGTYMQNMRSGLCRKRRTILPSFRRESVRDPQSYLTVTSIEFLIQLLLIAVFLDESPTNSYELDDELLLRCRGFPQFHQEALC